MNAPIQYIFGHQSLQDGTLDDDDIDREDGVPNEDEKRLAPTTSRQRAYEQDPFGDEECMVVQYRTMEWWHASFIMIAETISLGILSLPSVLATVGLVPGVILIVGLGIITTYTGYTIWQFKMAYPHVHNMADAGEVLGGAIGREIGGVSQTIFLIFVMGSHILNFTIVLNSISRHAACTIVWAAVALAVLWIFTTPRTLKKISYFSMVSVFSIFGSMVTAVAGIGIEKPIGSGSISVTMATRFAPAFLSVVNIIFSYAGHVAFFSFISELRNPKDFPKALYLLQIVDTSLYIVVAVVVYRYAGENVKSPAIGSAGEIVRRVVYGVSLPMIVVAGVIYCHVASKYIYVRFFRGTKHMGSRTLIGIGSWMAITLVLWLIAFVIAESIPNFNTLLTLISSLFASLFAYIIGGIFWLFVNKGKWWSSPRKMVLTFINCVIVLVGVGIMGMGVYVSGKALHDRGDRVVWSCVDNSIWN